MSDEIGRAVHDRAIVWLRSHVRAERYRAQRGKVAVDDPVVEAANEGRLLAMEQVGAISAKESAQWRYRLRTAVAATPDAPETVDDDLRARAAAHLEALARPVTPTTGELSLPPFSAIVACEQAGVLSAEQALAWREHLRSRMGVEPEHPPRCNRRELMRVVLGPAERLEGWRVTSVELYSDGVAVRWHHSQPWPDGPRTPRIWSNIDMATGEIELRTLEDDLGTRYSCSASGSHFGINGGGSVVRFGESVFTPAVPSAARCLRIGGIRVDLSTR